MTISTVAYDARLAIEPFRGMGRYLRMLIRGHEKNLLGFCATGESSPTLNLIAGGLRFYPAWEQVSLPRLISRFNVDTFIAPYNTAPLFLPSKVRLVLVVHDLIFLDPMPSSQSTYQNMGRLYRRMVVPRALQKAGIIVTVSESTKSQLIQRFGLTSGQIKVIPCSIGAEWFTPAGTQSPRDRYIFMVSGEAPSKNLQRGLEAFAALIEMTGDTNLQLKVAGVRKRYHHVFAGVATALGIGHAVHLLGYLPDEELRRLYREAELVVIPSLAEGFGIPVLEAMASRVPIAVSRAGSLPEVAGNAGLYFDPYAVDEMARRMREVLESASMRSEMIAAGERQLYRYEESAVQQQIDRFWSGLRAE